MKAQIYHKFFMVLVSMCLYFVFVVGMLLECISLRPLLGDVVLDPVTVQQIFLGHTVANIIMTWAYYRLLPPKYQANVLLSLSLYFLLGFFIPILANIGLLVVYLLGIKNEKISHHGDVLWRITGQPLMPNRAPEVQPIPKFDNYGMLSRLRKSTNIVEHLGIVLATRFMRDENAVPLLNIALKSPEDDVRLLAFSLLEKKQADINTRIEQLRQNLNGKDDTPKIHIAIAKNYFRLVMLGLVHEEMRSQALGKARWHLQETLNENPSDRNSHFILGQVLLEQGEIDQAQSSFTTALELGFAPSDVYPLLAKAAYMRREFYKIPECMGKIPAEHRLYPPLDDITAYWLQYEKDNLSDHASVAV